MAGSKDGGLDSALCLDTFLREINPGLTKYKQEFIKYDVCSLKKLKYLRPREVDLMNIPEVYKRMLIDNIINLHTPNTKSKMKVESDCAGHHQPKKLKFDNSHDGNSPKEKVSDSVSESEARSRPTQNDSFLTSELSRLTDEKETLVILLSHKDDELKDLKRHPVERDPMAIPGHPITKFICDSCHHRGHRSTMNRGNKNCPFVPCEGYNMCGFEAKHAEHKHALVEVFI